jgi:hypothetical protein
MRATFDDQLAELAAAKDSFAFLLGMLAAAGKQGRDSAHVRALRAAAAAQYIASCYTRIEGILKFVANEIDDEPLTGEDWHARLLARMTRARGEPAARPRVIGAKTRALLDELRQFRHVVRNAYSDRLREKDVMQNVNRLRRALSLFEQDFGRFVAYMRGERRQKKSPSSRSRIISRRAATPAGRARSSA